MVFLEWKFFMMNRFLCPHLLPWKLDPSVRRTPCHKWRNLDATGLEIGDTKMKWGNQDVALGTTRLLLVFPCGPSTHCPTQYAHNQKSDHGSKQDLHTISLCQATSWFTQSALHNYHSSPWCWDCYLLIYFFCAEGWTWGFMHANHTTSELQP